MFKKKFPVGVDIFEKVIKQNFYYVDKTDLIAELLITGEKLIYLPVRVVLVRH